MIRTDKGTRWVDRWLGTRRLALKACELAMCSACVKKKNLMNIIERQGMFRGQFGQLPCLWQSVLVAFGAGEPHIGQRLSLTIREASAASAAKPLNHMILFRRGNERGDIFNFNRWRLMDNNMIIIYVFIK